MSGSYMEVFLPGRFLGSRMSNLSLSSMGELVSEHMAPSNVPTVAHKVEAVEGELGGVKNSITSLEVQLATQMTELSEKMATDNEKLRASLELMIKSSMSGDSRSQGGGRPPPINVLKGVRRI
ncbi:hypothetical protein OROGR_000505 [Orobanche gracilis]